MFKDMMNPGGTAGELPVFIRNVKNRVRGKQTAGLPP